jgi:hypothetical protein
VNCAVSPARASFRSDCASFFLRGGSLSACGDSSSPSGASRPSRPLPWILGRDSLSTIEAALVMNTRLCLSAKAHSFFGVRRSLLPARPSSSAKPLRSVSVCHFSGAEPRSPLETRRSASTTHHSSKAVRRLLLSELAFFIAAIGSSKPEPRGRRSKARRRETKPPFAYPGCLSWRAPTRFSGYAQGGRAARRRGWLEGSPLHASGGNCELRHRPGQRRRVTAVDSRWHAHRIGWCRTGGSR